MDGLDGHRSILLSIPTFRSGMVPIGTVDVWDCHDTLRWGADVLSDDESD